MGTFDRLLRVLHSLFGRHAKGNNNMTKPTIDFNALSDHEIREGINNYKESGMDLPPMRCYGTDWRADDTGCQVECPLEPRCSKILVTRGIPRAIQMRQGDEGIGIEHTGPLPDEIVAETLGMTKDNLAQLRKRVSTGKPIVEKDAPEPESESERPSPPELVAGEEEDAPELVEVEDKDEAQALANMEDYMEKHKPTKAKKAKKATTKKATTKKATTKKATTKKATGPSTITVIPAIIEELAESGVLIKAGHSDAEVLSMLPEKIRQVREFSQALVEPVVGTNEELLQENMLLKALLKGAKFDPDGVVEMKMTDVMGLLQD